MDYYNFFEKKKEENPLSYLTDMFMKELKRKLKEDEQANERMRGLEENYKKVWEEFCKKARQKEEMKYRFEKLIDEFNRRPIFKPRHMGFEDIGRPLLLDLPRPYIPEGHIAPGFESYLNLPKRKFF